MSWRSWVSQETGFKADPNPVVSILSLNCLGSVELVLPYSPKDLEPSFGDTCLASKVAWSMCAGFGVIRKLPPRRQKNTLPRSEAALQAAADLGPIHVNLGSYRLTFEDCMWTPDYEAPEIPEGAGAIEQEICKLRRDKRKMLTCAQHDTQRKELDRFMEQAKEMKDLKERWNLLDFKYQLLLDMWTMRALDQKKEEACGVSQRRLSGEGSSPKRSSPKRNARSCNNDSPPRNRHHFCNSSPPKRRERTH